MNHHLEIQQVLHLLHGHILFATKEWQVMKIRLISAGSEQSIGIKEFKAVVEVPLELEEIQLEPELVLQQVIQINYLY